MRGQARPLTRPTRTIPGIAKPVESNVAVDQARPPPTGPPPRPLRERVGVRGLRRRLRPTPRTRRARLVAPAHPRIFFAEGAAPHTPPDEPSRPAKAASPMRGNPGASEGVRRPPERRPRGGGPAPAPRARCRGGLRPPHPHPGRARCAARGPPTRPRIFFMWGRAPRPRNPDRAPAAIEAPSGPLAPAGEGPRTLGFFFHVAHRAPSPPRGQTPAGEPRSPPGTTPRLPPQPQESPSGSSRGGVGGSPPLRQQPPSGSSRPAG